MDILQSKLKNLLADGVDNLHILADFDGTITREYVDGVKTPSAVSIFRDNPKYFPESYRTKAHELFEHYYPIEMNPDLPMDFRKSKMIEWWNAHFQLLIDYKIKKSYIEEISESGMISSRSGVTEFLNLTHKLQIPVIIISASALGESIEIYLKSHGLLHDNIHLFVNKFIWNEEGIAVDVQRPIFHSLNKDETELAEFPNLKKEISKRKNVLVLGNAPGDAKMSHGLAHDQKLTIGFVDPEEQEERVQNLKKCFDFVLTDDYNPLNSSLRQCAPIHL